MGRLGEVDKPGGGPRARSRRARSRPWGRLGPRPNRAVGRARRRHDSIVGLERCQQTRNREEENDARGKKKENSTLNAKKPKTRGIRRRAQRRGWWIYELKDEWDGWLVETLKRSRTRVEDVEETDNDGCDSMRRTRVSKLK